LLDVVVEQVLQVGVFEGQRVPHQKQLARVHLKATAASEIRTGGEYSAAVTKPRLLRRIERR
jgi:hypothetical protein